MHIFINIEKWASNIPIPGVDSMGNHYKSRSARLPKSGSVPERKKNSQNYINNSNSINSLYLLNVIQNFNQQDSAPGTERTNSKSQERNDIIDPNQKSTTTQTLEKNHPFTNSLISINHPSTQNQKVNSN